MAKRFQYDSSEFTKLSDAIRNFRTDLNPIAILDKAQNKTIVEDVYYIATTILNHAKWHLMNPDSKRPEGYESAVKDSSNG